jgi:hypothetical protein
MKLDNRCIAEVNVEKMVQEILYIVTTSKQKSLSTDMLYEQY